MSREELIEELRMEEELERRSCEKSYYNFLKSAWDVLEPGTELVDNWHIKYLCDKLQEKIEIIARREPKGLDINVNICPRSIKSYIFSIMLVPWTWIHYPNLRFICSSHSDSLSTEFSVKSRRLIDSQWYQGHWSDKFQLTSDQNVKTHFENNHKGHRIATSVGSKIAGKGADVVVGDDLLDVTEGYSEAKINAVNVHWDIGLSRRLNDHHVGLKINVQQRVCEEDLTGYLQQNYPNDFEFICIPVEISEDISPPELVNFYEGGLFFPARFTAADIENYKKNDDMFLSQYMQRPAPKTGKIIDRDWWKFYTHLPDTFDDMIQSWDATFKGEEEAKGKPDYVVGLVIARKGTNIYIIDCYRDRADIDETKKTMLKFYRQYPQAHKVFIEDKANGPAIKTQLKKIIFGIEAVEPQGNKVERLVAVKNLISGGHVHLPHPDQCGWTNPLINRVAAFPTPKVPDDEVDAISQGLLKIEQNWSIIAEYETLMG